VIEPAWLWPHSTMRSEREEMRGIRYPGMPTPTLLGTGERPAVTVRADPRCRQRPTAVSFDMGVPADLITRAHDRGILWLQTVADAESAQRALEAGADVLIAQGGEAGGNSGWVATMVLVPEVIDLAGDVPVVAAGGIPMAAGSPPRSALGAQGVSMGTRFLAPTEMAIDQVWKARICEAKDVDAVKLTHSERVMPPFTVPQIGIPLAPRSLRTPLVDQLEQDPRQCRPLHGRTGTRGGCARGRWTRHVALHGAIGSARS
jgi:NAD(P)H-dependent flavin oxidoreductase YrpB (nitropropane dioxygenase family)